MTRKALLALVPSLVVAALIAATWAIWRGGGDAWLFHTAGLDNASGPWYLTWSGIVGDLTLLGALGVGAGLYRKHNCHTPRCWRLSRHDWVDADGVTHVLCRKHHPSIHDGNRPTPEYIAAHEAKKARDG